MATPANMAAARRAMRTQGGDIDVDDELQQLLKEQEAFMRQNQRPAAKITRVGAPPTPVETPAEGAAPASQEAPEEAPLVVRDVQERDVVQLNESNRNVRPRAAVGGFPAVRKRGESLFGRRQRQQAAQPTGDPSKMLSGAGRIVERAPAVVKASDAAKQTRSDVVSEQEWEEIDQTNKAALSAMSAREIREAQEELYRMLDPALITKLKSRTQMAPRKAEEKRVAPTKPVGTVAENSVDLLASAGIDLAKIETEDELFEQAKRLPAEERAKHEWMQSVDEEKQPKASRKRHPVRQNHSKKRGAAASTERFDFNGDSVVEGTAVPVHSGLYHHGDDPESAGYSMDELLHLARSTVASQRTVALTTISKTLRKRQLEKAPSERIPKVLPRELPVALRMTLDDQNYTALSAAVTALHAFLCPVQQDSAICFEYSRGTVVPMPKIHTHVDGGATKEELLHEVVYIDTAESPEDGSVIGDEELSALDPVQGLLKMNIVARISYIVTTIQLPDEDAMALILDIIIHIAAHSPRAAQAVVSDRKLLKALQTKYLENERVLTLQTDPLDQFKRAVMMTTKCLQLVRVLAQGSRSAASSLAEVGIIQTTKGFLALRGDDTGLLDGVQLESLRVWRVLLSYGLDFHCFSYLYPLLCGFDGVNLVRDGDRKPTGVKGWSAATLAGVFTALEAFARLDTVHEAQHYFTQFAFFVSLAKDEVAARLSDGASEGEANDDSALVVSTALRFLATCAPLVGKFHMDKQAFQSTFTLVRTELGRAVWRASAQRSHASRELLAAATAFSTQVLQNDLLGDDEDDDEVRAQLLQRLKPVISSALVSRPEDSLLVCELLLLGTRLVVRSDHHDDAFIRELYAVALAVVQDLKPGHQFWIHSLFTEILFSPVVLQKTGFFPDVNDATTMSRVLIPIYQALVNSTKDQEEHSRVLFASTERINPKLKQTCHAVEPQDEQDYIGSNLPLPFFWMFCPFSRLEYASVESSEEKQKRSASHLGPTLAQADEMKVIVSAACRYIDQLEAIVGDVKSSSSDKAMLGDEDKLFHLMHVFFAGADVLFDDYVDLALAKLLKKYAVRVLKHKSPSALYDGILRNLRQFESIEAGEDKQAKLAQTQSFATETETVMTFVEKLVNEFTASSFGNAHFARVITLFMLHDFPLAIRKWVWKELSDSHLVHRLEPFDGGAEARQLTGCRSTRDARKSDEILVRSMTNAIAARSPQISHERGPFAYWLAIHHITAYLFGDDGDASTALSFARQKLLQDMTTELSPVVWRHVLSYDCRSYFPLTDTHVDQSRVDRVLQQAALSDAQAAAFRAVVIN